jgi:hypothetical protein
MSTSIRTETREVAVKSAVVACAALLLFAVTAAAQRKSSATAEDTRWLPYVGCWSRSSDPGATSQVVCVKPGAGAAADIITLTNGTVDSREHIEVDGQPHPIDKDGCTGSQTATWASSGNRIFIGSAYSCGSSLHGRSTRMFAILPSGVWLDVRDVHAGGGWVETVTRFHDAGLPSTVPADIRSEIANRELAVATARAAASAPVNANDIAEAARSVDTAVVQSWLSARGQAYLGDSTVVASQSSPVPVYRGTPAPAPAAEPAPATPLVDTGCDPFGCYAPNVYSGYNGVVFSPYARPYVYAYPPYYPGFVSPVIVIRGSTGRGRPPIIRPPAGHGPVGHSPIGHTPAGAAPPRAPNGPRTQPVVANPRVGMPSRIRP